MVLTSRYEINQHSAEEPVEIAEETNFAGTLDGDVIVSSGGALYLFGTISRDLTVQPGGKAMIFGTVMGDAWNWGGTLEIYGTIQGRLNRQAGTTLMGRDSRVGKQ